MKTKIVFFCLIMLPMAYTLTAQNHKSVMPDQPLGYPISYDYKPLKLFGKDTNSYFAHNFYNTLRYDGKKFQILFDELEKDMPIKTIIFFKTDEGRLSAFYFFFEDKKKIAQQIKAEVAIRTIQANIDGYPLEQAIPHVYKHIEKWGYGKFLDMNDEIRKVLGSENAGKVFYLAPSLPRLKRSLELP